MCLCIYRPPKRKHCFFYVFSNALPMLYLFLMHLCILLQNIDAYDAISGEEQIKGSRSLFSPRMQYDEWTPLGRGDPLKNDPTFDYVPPVLDRVHYWVPPAARTPDPPRSTTISTTSTSSTRPVPVIQDRFQDLAVSRIRQQYIPLIYQYRPNLHRPPYTILVPPPPGKPHNYSLPPSIPVTTTTTAVNDFWETQIVPVAPTTQTQRKNYPQIDPTPSPSILHFLLNDELAPSTIPPPTIRPTILQSSSSVPFTSSSTTTTSTSTSTSTTNNPSLTTDPLFSHYKQPIEPLRGPMYLIIQGHSKVKTYGPTKLDKISGIPVQETNEVIENEDFRNQQNKR